MGAEWYPDSDTDGFDADCDGIEEACGIPAGDADVDDVSARFTGAAGEAYVARSVAAAGDLDGDGFGDAIIGDPGVDDQGAAWLFYGDSVGRVYDAETDGVRLSGPEPEELAGQHVCGPGDFNGDGLPELVVANNIGDGGDAVRGGGVMFLGSRTRLESQALSDADVVYEGTPTAGLFGTCAGVGDVDDDGRADLAFSGARNGRPGWRRAHRSGDNLHTRRRHSTRGRPPWGRRPERGVRFG